MASSCSRPSIFSLRRASPYQLTISSIFSIFFLIRLRLCSEFSTCLSLFFILCQNCSQFLLYSTSICSLFWISSWFFDRRLSTSSCSLLFYLEICEYLSSICFIIQPLLFSSSSPRLTRFLLCRGTSEVRYMKLNIMVALASGLFNNIDVVQLFEFYCHQFRLTSHMPANFLVAPCRIITNTSKVGFFSETKNSAWAFRAATLFSSLALCGITKFSCPFLITTCTSTSSRSLRCTLCTLNRTRNVPFDMQICLQQKYTIITLPSSPPPPLPTAARPFAMPMHQGYGMMGEDGRMKLAGYLWGIFAILLCVGESKLVAGPIYFWASRKVAG